MKKKFCDRCSVQQAVVCIFSRAACVLGPRKMLTRLPSRALMLQATAPTW